MNSKVTNTGNSDIIEEQHNIQGKLVQIENETFYKIENNDAMRPFFMSIVSDSNHWMFISSNGGLSAGRKNSDNALFPYYTDDKITESREITGSKSIFMVHSISGAKIWEPFSDRFDGLYNVTNNLYKNTYGNKVIFEEINHDLGLTYSYEWNSSNIYGFVKKSILINTTKSAVKISLLDGIQNVMPYGVSSDFQNSSSNLIDAYKKSELEKETGLGIFALSAIIVDIAEPSEALKANIVWSLGLDNPKYLLSSLQLKNFRKYHSITEELDVKAEKGAYFVNVSITLQAEAQKEWMLIANVNQDQSAIVSVCESIKTQKHLQSLIEEDIARGTKKLIDLVASSDGLQSTADSLRDTRHFANTLFNIMRGGIFNHNYQIPKKDFIHYLSKANKEVFATSKQYVNELADDFLLSELKTLSEKSDDINFKRLCLEYMPLKFSRRHGDPSRPWNKFSINTLSEIDGSEILDYQGNWRDIFQNWEALAYAYPDFVESMIHKFLNATTFDGYNPYRITKDGFDWEVIEAHDPWSYIGYWGDHQIIYLLKFLEFIENHNPGKLNSYFNQNVFVYANVPYKIKTYEETLKNPKDTIDFDYKLNEIIDKKRLKIGADGALLLDRSATIYNVNFIEKVLATLLAKVSNFIPEAGIWLNTQRPEWNDANNALVGNGVSMVTLYYLKRFLNFLGAMVENSALKETLISKELLQFFNMVSKTLYKNRALLIGTISDTDRKTILDELGSAGSLYRTTIYNLSFTANKKPIKLKDIAQFITITTAFFEHTIKANKREDNLYHAYNLMTVTNENEVSISYLDEMLEGQVAVLSSGYISSIESLELLDALKSSKLLREDQYSYFLYPNKELPRFLAKNIISYEAIAKSELLQRLIADGNGQIVKKDSRGDHHFNGNFNNAKYLEAELSKLEDSPYSDLVKKDKTLLLETFEKVFNHKAFTGRSGTFYGYEGLGSIYWHMVSKLQLAVQETCLKAIEDKESTEVIGRLLEHYYEINEGIGVRKSPSVYGAFPTDPYSHTPGGKGAQQPGMTGQVKEDILSRIGELGVFVENGKIVFNSCLLRQAEFLSTEKEFNYIDVDGNEKQISLAKNTIAFTYCKVPVIYNLFDKNGILVTFKNKKTKSFDRLVLDKEVSSEIFSRTGEIEQIAVFLTKGNFN
jgi:hypothetical protein